MSQRTDDNARRPEVVPFNRGSGAKLKVPPLPAFLYEGAFDPTVRPRRGLLHDPRYFLEVPLTIDFYELVSVFPGNEHRFTFGFLCTGGHGYETNKVKRRSGVHTIFVRKRPRSPRLPVVSL
jgi:hypothetical protein